MKNAWLIYRKEDALKNQKYIQMYIEEGMRKNIFFRLLYHEKIIIGNERENLFFLYEGKKEEYPCFVIQRVFDTMLTKQLEKIGIHVFNNSTISEICNNKARTYQCIAGLGVPCIPTTFHKNEELVYLSFTKNQVIKAVDGHGGKQVFSGESKIKDIRKGIGKSDFIVQEKIIGEGKDIRVYVIGKEIIAAVCRKSGIDFRANFSLGATISLHEMNDKQIRLVKKIIDHFPFALVGIDFLVDDRGEWLLNEIEDVVGARMLYQCSDVNLVEKYLTYIINEMERGKSE